MKKIILITSGILILLLAIAVFAYLFLFGTPKSAGDIFANFGIGSGSTTDFAPVPEEIVFTETQAPIVASNTLRQITTKPVAGMVFLTSDTVRYVEQGTGHIFDVALDTGTETQVSNTTFTKVQDARFSPDGTKVILTYTEAGQTRNSFGLIADGVLTTTSLLSGAHDFSWNDSGSTVYYIVETPDGTEGYAYDVTAKTSSLLYRAPFGSARAIWGETDYIYTKPAASLRGYIYEVTDGALEPLTQGRFGLMATPFRDGTVITEVTRDGLVSNAFTSEDTYEVPLALFPEKCAVSTNGADDLICGGPFELPQGATLPDDWYKGAVTFADLLWSVNIEAGEAALIVDPRTETGRTIDVSRMEAASSTDQYLLINKTNNTLWLLTP